MERRAIRRSRTQHTATGFASLHPGLRLLRPPQPYDCLSPFSASRRAISSGSLKELRILCVAVTILVHVN
jgi:hypothetical protein